MAPEVIFVSSKYDAKKADVWSCGIILYAMILGHYPFNPADPKLPKKMMEGAVSFPPGIPVSPECRDIIQGGQGKVGCVSVCWGWAIWHPSHSTLPACVTWPHLLRPPRPLPRLQACSARAPTSARGWTTSAATPGS
jgi:serine/threonine protein kinase